MGGIDETLNRYCVYAVLDDKAVEESMTRGICKGLCFVSTAMLAYGFGHYPTWLIGIIGFVIGITAAHGWGE